MHTLRARLTLLYVAVAGGMFLVMSVAVYGLTGVFLMRQLDQSLRKSAEVVIDTMTFATSTADGAPLIVLPENLPLPPGTIVRIWDRHGHIVYPTAHTGNMLLPKRSVEQPEFYTARTPERAWRVFSVPIHQGSRLLVTLQIATPLDPIKHAQRILLVVLAGVTLLAITITAIVGYVSIDLSMRPLAHVTAVADQITHADDLSRRVPVPRGASDEVWTLVRAFNATLARLEALFRAQRRFIADVGHELRTPLTVIKGNAQWMRRIDALDKEALDSIEEEADRMTRLVEDLLLLARAEAGKLPLRHETVALETVLAEVAREIQVMAREKGIALRLEISEPVVVLGDADRLKQVFINLASNAVKYTPQGGEVVLTLETEPGWAVCRVKDNGPGIPPEDLPHVFERFYRADKARSRGKGFGLGLSIAYWIVKHHGGEITAASEMGKGTTFTVRLPAGEHG